MIFTKIQARNDWLTKVPELYPGTLEYITFWRREYHRCVEGMWKEDFDGWRYMPGVLYFYVNYYSIRHYDDKLKSRVYMKPYLRDIEWERGYIYATARGFSGFSEDDEFTCDLRVQLYENGKKNVEYLTRLSVEAPYLFNSKGKIKKFTTPFEYLRMIHDRPKGRPMFHNPALNNMELGTRGGGKQIQLHEQVRVKDGWTIMGKLKVGDEVYGADGKLTKITWKSAPEKGDYYRITLRDGRTIEACSEHTWKVVKNGKNINMSTKEMYENYYYERIDSKHKRKYNENKIVKEYTLALPTNKEIEDSYKELPLDPYFLGLMLGDGYLGAAPSITSKDEEIINTVKEICDRYNWTYRLKEEKGVTTAFITNKHKVKSLRKYLEELGLFNTRSDTKFILKYIYTVL